MKLKSIVPWGRNLNEYRLMFALTNNDLECKILGCADGPASFNAELTKLGGSVISFDIIYKFSKDDIKNRIDKSALEVISRVKSNKDEFVWSSIKSVEELYSIRINAMNSFLNDYEKGIIEGRYIQESFPKLTFKDNEFDLALSSHLLFLYSEHLDYNFHLNSIIEMLRVAKDIRIFPIIDLNGKKSKHLNRIIKELENRGFKVTIKRVDYEFQKGANEMLQVIKI